MECKRDCRTQEIRVIDHGELTLIKELTSESMGRISLYDWNRGNYAQRVIKKSLPSPVTETQRSALKKEMAILPRMRHENIIKTLGVVQANNFGIIVEYCHLGSYREFFWRVWKVAPPNVDLHRLSAPLKLRIIQETISAMQYLHQRGVFHLDLKSENVLLNDDLHAKVCDFGLSQMKELSKVLSTQTRPGAAVGGTPGRIPPERLLDPCLKPTNKSDVYSFSILQWEILTDKYPYEEMSGMNIHILETVIAMKNQRPDLRSIPNVYDRRLIGMMTSSWSTDPNDRPTFDDLQEKLSPILKSFDDFEREAGKTSQNILSLYNSHRQKQNSATSNHVTSQPVSMVSTEEETREENAEASEAETEPLHRQGAQDTTPKSYTTPASRASTNPADSSISNATETTTLLPPLDTTTKIIVSPKKIVIAISVLLSICALVAVVVWFTVDSDCIDPSLPSNGSMNCTESSGTVSRKCAFSCNQGYSLVGNEEITCSSGEWNHKSPICARVCPQMHLMHGEMNCSHQNFVYSKCTIRCKDNHILKGDPELICLENGTWSNSTPECVCPHCYIGDECTESIGWKYVQNSLCEVPKCSSNIDYGGHIIRCWNSILGIAKYYGVCTDLKTGNETRCSPYESPSGSMEHAVSQLVRSHASHGLYPEPCDPQSWPTDC